MRENIKNIGLILAIIIAGVSLPTSIISVMNKPRIIQETIIENHYYNQTLVVNNTIIEEYYYNETIIEEYNNTIIEYYNTTTIINNTIIEQYNNTIIINNTEYIPINRTIEYYHFAFVQPNDFFFNATFNITFWNVNIVFFTVYSFLASTLPWVWVYKNGNYVGDWRVLKGGMVGFIWTPGFYEVRFENYNMIQNIDITIEIIEV